MSEPKISSPLVPDISKMNVYEETPESVNQFTQPTENALKLLEERYSNPNWFKVSAGFLKPQLGGFGASLGSAFDALGENVEQQKSIALPIAQARAQIALMQNQLGHKTTASQAIEKYKRENPDQPLPPELINYVTLHDKERGESLQRELQTNVELVREKRNFLEQQFKQGAITPEQYQQSLKDLALMSSILSVKPSTGTANINQVSAPNVGAPSTGATVSSPNAQSSNIPPVEQIKENVGSQDKPIERVVLKTPGSEFSALNPSSETIKGNERLYEQLDAQGKEHLAELNKLGSPKAHTTNMRPIKDILKYSDDPRFNKIMAVLSGNGLLSGLGTLLENGLNVNAAGFQAAISVPLSKIALSIKDEKEQAFAQNVYRALAQIELNNQRSIGLNPSSARNAEFSLLSNAAAHPDTLPSAARLYAKQSELNQLRNRDLYDDVNNLIYGKHKKYVVDPNSPTKMYLYQNSPSQQKIIDQYDTALDAEVEKYLKATGGVKP